MMYCYVVASDGYTLINDQGVPVGRVIDLERQILGKDIKRAREPTGWFTGLVYKKLKIREST